MLNFTRDSFHSCTFYVKTPLGFLFINSKVFYLPADATHKFSSNWKLLCLNSYHFEVLDLFSMAVACKQSHVRGSLGMHACVSGEKVSSLSLCIVTRLLPEGSLHFLPICSAARAWSPKCEPAHRLPWHIHVLAVQIGDFKSCSTSHNSFIEY